MATHLGSVLVTGEADALHLLRLGLLALDKEEVPVNDIQDVMLPSELTDRVRIASETSGLAARLEQTKQRMETISESIDEIVAAGLSLTLQEHDQIRDRCRQFPLSVTVERPRYIWSPDRKRQARRTYQLGERFR